MESVTFKVSYKHDNETWRGKTTSHNILGFKVKENDFTKNPHNYRRMYTLSSQNGAIILSVNNLCDVYLRSNLNKEFQLYKGFEQQVEVKSFNNLKEALDYLKKEYYLKINFKGEELEWLN